LPWLAGLSGLESRVAGPGRARPGPRRRGRAGPRHAAGRSGWNSPRTANRGFDPC